MIDRMDEGLLRDYAGWLKRRGLKSPEAYSCQARILLRWLSGKGLALAELGAPQLNDFLCWRRARARRQVTVYNGWHRLTKFLLYLATRKLAPGGLAEMISCCWLDQPGGLPAYQGVLRGLYTRAFPMRRYRLTLFGPDLEGHVKDLLARGYSRSSALYVLNAAYRLHEFLVRKKTKSLLDVEPPLLGAFIRWTRARFRDRRGRAPSEFYMYVTKMCVARFVAYAFSRRGRRFQEAPAEQDSPLLPDRLLERYLEFCRAHRGLKPATQESHRQALQRMRTSLDDRGIRRLEDVTAADLQALCLDLARTRTPQGIAGVLGPVRRFFQYLHLQGRIECDPGRGLLLPCGFRDALRPKYLPWPKVERLLAGVDLSTPRGKRDYAILVLLACHGLRAREAAGIRVQDVDFEKRSVFLRERKGGVAQTVPLSDRAAKALRDYLSVRPARACEEVFLTSKAPLHPLGIRLWSVAWRHLDKRFGPSIPGHGSYVLRHSFAKAMLDRGAPLHDIGLLLGHRRLTSALTYTRVDTEGLREVADNYAAWL